ncbi:MBL fold metallo-hydrolase [Clostridium botulinum]|uniref:MBL fold metallo-hydrolase n=3 Tax=Clostridium botulinum TaxID=1491 RepID=A0A6B4JN30_CLOBO|nr:MBL fold metallo-hydrolase [Clostridium botulinum]MBY6762212.1 MBL fold metallo-hydrolase [Clostridium botulinum]MBY6920475.1 MBL fold metallo-hydrolase [Clostridium botulinum]NFJ58319.1 MBL fold metallo-hydrolase [Clostridium botulinum]NFL50722.1 MBL fold metallo-hydrolase [Clostridium botulinum]
MKIVNPFDNSRKTMFAKMYIDTEWFEELALNLPNDLLYRLFNKNYDEDELNYLIDLVGQTIKDIPYFPFKLNFSLINEGVVTLDSIFNNNASVNIINTYKPYFCEFSGYCKYEEFIKLIKYSIKNECEFFTCFLDFSEQLNYQNENNIIAIVSGNVLFSASPIIEKGGRLVIVRNEHIIDKKFMPILDGSIYQFKNKPISVSEKSNLKKTIDNVCGVRYSPEYIRVFNVGQANNICIKLNNQKHIFFDVGLTKSKVERNQSEIKSAIKEYSEIKADMVVLSHWDIDHILGLAYLDNSIYDALWIVPDLWGLMKYGYKKNGVFKFKYISDSAKRLLKYLDYKNNKNLLIIDEDWKRDCIYNSINNNICLWTGERKSVKGINNAKQPYCINEANNFGLILTIKNKKNVLLPGDCDYSTMPDKIWETKYEYLVTSHHCSKMSKIPMSKSNKYKKAILSYGITNNYGHPNNQHIKELSQIGYQIVTTLGHRHIRCDLK